jgi:hypothetical protein
MQNIICEVGAYSNEPLTSWTLIYVKLWSFAFNKSNS